MKLSAIILLATVLQVAARTEGQTVTLRVRNEPVKKVLLQIQKSTGLDLLIDEALLEKAGRVTFQVENRPVLEVLERCFQKEQVTYAVINGRIVIKPVVIDLPQAAKTFANSKPLPPVIIVKGKIVDEQGNPLSGASIKIKGSNKGTSSDDNGNFLLEVPDQEAVLLISFVGYQSMEMPTSQSGELRITLKRDDGKVEEVVVVGYGTQKKVNLTGAVASVDGDVLKSRPIVNLGQGLQGFLPNLNITLGNGSPGRGATYNIRGTTSLNGGGPLVLVDGVQMDPNLINPADVENVTVLKDAASAAIYGVRAAYGVILITTKNPKRNAPLRISYSTSYTFTRPTRMPEYANSLQYAAMHREADYTGSISGGTRAGEAVTLEDSTNIAKFFNDPVNNLPVYVDPGNPSKYRYVGNTDWIKELYPGWAPMMDHNLSLSGGQGKTAYVASLGYFNQKGLLKIGNEKVERYNAGLKLNTEATTWLDLNFRMSLNRTQSNKPNVASHGGLSTGWISGDLRPTMPVYHPDGHYSGQGSYTNMVALANLNGRIKEVANDLWLTGGFVIRPFNHVRVTADYTWNGYNRNYTQHYKEYKEYGVNGVLLGTFPWTTPSRVIEVNNNDYYQALNAYADYENTFAQRHYVKATVGYNQELKQFKSYTASAKNLIDQTVPAINLNSDNLPTVGGSAGEWALNGTFFRVNYAYDGKYLLEVNGRYDGTSRFPRGKRYTFLPSVSAGWRISKEKFFDPLLGIVDDLKLRASWGTLGNQAGDVLGNYPYLATMPVGTVAHVFTNQLGVFVGVPGLISPDFSWEKVTTQNFGLDAAFFKNRLTLGFDWYIRATKDMIVGGTPLPAVLGTTSPNRNAADLETKGWELSLGWKDVLNKDISYDVNLVLSDYKARITKYDLNPQKVIGSRYPGENIGEIWGFVTDGFFQTDAEAAAANQSNLWNGKWLAGDIRFTDLNKDGKVDFGKSTVDSSGDRRVIGNNTPRYQFGLNLSVAWKGIDLTLFIQGLLKRDVVLSGSPFWGYTDEWSIPWKHHADSWRPDNTNAYYPRLRFGGGGNFQTQTKYLQNAAYARMKQITVGYTLPRQLLEKVKLKSTRVYFTAQNLFEITKLHKAFDPEVLNGQDYPLNRAVSFGLQLGL
ncbi:TonB-dependent receptor [Pseudoflavitalea sp. X16]|uniref:SusC/RagA family TonB-linked outer membrane protein n=1 Tax=Paraflavitalea devenefica TaxID=2716334 RepID=UPI00142014AC|nr:TonB-dependent receptor [Paraflavitalea devenefica]NII29789.1 TonB-dependent receptor [Paraflavitalea devenefica]